jgi:hypothetical protein
MSSFGIDSENLKQKWQVKVLFFVCCI